MSRRNVDCFENRLLNVGKPLDQCGTKYKEDEDLSDCVNVITKDRKENRPYFEVCSRCESRSMVNTVFPYCMNCGWDSLHDQSWSHAE